MTKSENIHIQNFLCSMASKYHFSWSVLPEISRLTPAEKGRGRKLVKTALYHIRRGLKTGSIWGVSINDCTLVRYFAGPEHVEEIINLGGFPTFWSPNDRSHRAEIMTALAANVKLGDIAKLKKFHKKLGRIEYESNPEWNDYDQKDFRRVLDATTKNNIPICVSSNFVRA